MLLGLEISSQSASAVLSDDAGGAQLALRQEFAPHAPPATQWMGAVELCRALLHRAALEPSAIARLGISFPAPVSRAGVVLNDPTHPGWQGYDLRRGAREHLLIEEVVAAPRAVCEGWGEAHFGALREKGDWLYLHLGATLESALCLGGQMRLGSGGAGDIGGLIIERDGALDGLAKRGTLRAYCGGEAFQARARSYGMAYTRAEEIWHLAEANFAAQSLVEDFIERLAQGLASAISLVEPAHICIGGSFGRAIFPQMAAPLASKLRDMAPAQPPILAAALGEDAATLGAVALALEPNF